MPRVNLLLVADIDGDAVSAPYLVEALRRITMDRAFIDGSVRSGQRYTYVAPGGSVKTVVTFGVGEGEREARVTVSATHVERLLRNPTSFRWWAAEDAQSTANEIRPSESGT